MIAHNLLRAAGTLAGGPHAVARGATLRRHLVNVPARLARPPAHPCCTYPPLALGTRMAATVGQHHRPHHAAHPPLPDTNPPQPGPSTPTVEKLDRPAAPARLRHQHA